MQYQVNAMGKPCPIPVVEAKKVLAQMSAGDTVTVSVDNAIAVQNLLKMAGQKKLAAESRTLASDHYEVVLALTEESLAAAQAPATEEAPACIPDARAKGTVVVLSSDEMGSGDPVLGKALMKAFVYALTEQDILPDTILLYNGGAKLSVEGAPTLADLKLLESQGVEIMTCGTCLNHYGLTEQLAVGSVTNMYAIAEKLMGAARVVRP